MEKFEQIAVRINSKEDYKKSKKLFKKLGYKNDKKWNESYVDKIGGVIKYNLGFESGMFSLQSSCVNFKTFKSIKEFKEYVKSKETKKGKLTIVVSKNYKELYEDNLALVNNILLDTVKNDKEWIEKVQKSNLNITLYTDKNDTELFKKSFGKFEVKLMDCEVNTSPLGKTAIVRKEELVSGWYKYEGTKYLMYHNFETNTKFGFNTIGEWRNILNNVKDNTKYIKADIKEIEERLKEEAVKRGFKEGIKVRNHQVGDRELINFSLESIKYSGKYHIGIYLTTGTGTWLMMDGIWAEIVEEKLTLENIQVDCSELTSEQIEEMKRVVVENGYKLWDDAIAFYIIKDAKYFQYNTGTFCILINNNDLTTITYDKFMDLFGSKKVTDNGSTISNVTEGEAKSIEELHVEHKEQSFNGKCEQDYKDVCKAYGISEEDAKPKGLCVEWMEEFNKIPGHVFDALKFRTPQGQSMLKVDSNQVNTTFNPQSHYNNEFGSLYKMSEQLGLNAYEFDILKRVVRCRKKVQFEEDLQKTKDLIDLYLIESKK